MKRCLTANHSWSSLYKWCGLTDLQCSIRAFLMTCMNRNCKKAELGKHFIAVTASHLSFWFLIWLTLKSIHGCGWEILHPSLWFFLCRLCKCCLHSSCDISCGPLLLEQYSRALSKKKICIHFHVNQKECVVYGRQIVGTGGMRSLFPSAVLFPEMQSVCYHLGDTWACRWGFPYNYHLIAVAGLAPVHV